MVWFWVIVLVAIVGAIAVVAAGRGGEMADVYDDRPDATIPAGRPLTADDIHEVQLRTGFRGYRMDEVDALLQRVEADLLARETGSPAAVPGAVAGDQPSVPPAEHQRGEPASAAPAEEARAAEPGDNWPYE